MSTDLLQLQEPLTEGGIRTVNFFNGRLLTAKDLSREQAARAEADARLGMATGDGVAFGLEVERDGESDEPQAPVLRVHAGLAVNRAGQTLRLISDTSVALTRRFDAAPQGGVFAACEPLTGGVYVAGAGVYLLTIAPAQQTEGRAPTNGLDASSDIRCNTDARIEAVQFRLLGIDRSRFLDLDLAASQFRNRLAYRCFGIEVRQQAGIDPWRIDPPRYGLIDELRTVGLSDCDVPLALVYWTSDGLQFIDMWAARRALLEPDALSGFAFQRNPLDSADLSSFAFIARTRRIVEAHAMCAQFQQHLADILAAQSNPAAVLATDFFRYLPPFGVVPLQASPLRGFDDSTFFSGLVRRPPPGANQLTEFVDTRLLGALQVHALALSPTDVTQREFIWVYRPWQNVKAAAEGQSVQEMIVFSTGQMPDLATARFDMARADFSDYANCCGGS